jgi:uncharacterized protein YbaR (Trm112 family)
METARDHLVCPASRQALREAAKEELVALRTISNQPKLEAAWIRADSTMAYPVQNGIPQLIPSAAIAIPKFSSSTP